MTRKVIDGLINVHFGETEHQPQFIESTDVDSWLDAIAAGRGVGTTADATAHHHQRPGVTYRPIKDGPRIPVRLAWWHDHRPHGLGPKIQSDRIPCHVRCLHAKGLS